MFAAPNFIFSAQRTPAGQTVFLGNVYPTTASQNSYSWVVPDQVSSINVVLIGSGASGSAASSTPQSARAGDLRYINNLSVTPGETLTILCGNGVTQKTSAGSGSATEIKRGATVLLSAAGGNGQSGTSGTSSTIGGNIGGGNGGDGGTPSSTQAGGGGGTGGYSGNGGSGENFDTSYTAPASNSGSAAGGKKANGGRSDGGGGVNLIKQGTTAAGAQSTEGSNGNDGYTTAGGYGTGFYGAGGQCKSGSTTGGGGQGSPGACRIIWGVNRTFPDASDDYIPAPTASYSQIEVKIRIPSIATDTPIESINLFQVVITDENNVNFMSGLTAVAGDSSSSFSSITTGQFTLSSRSAIDQVNMARLNNGLYDNNITVYQVNETTPMSLFIKPTTAKRIKQIKLYTENRSIWSFVNWMEVYGDGNLLTYGQVIPIWSVETTVGGQRRVPTITFT